ncbi:hypothetical protein [Dethiothermospora halolimnae]|uniref:hypothetical protein n=1 Tax=Dethiothermospora halolimnae TaxID=3114390 RepID=UPI003CCB8893
MAVYRHVQITFWQDAFVLDLTPEEKYFYLYLMTNSKTSQSGIYELPKKIIKIETGYNRETVEKLIQRFVEYGKILYNDSTKEIMLLNWVKYNGSNSPKVMSKIEKELKNIKDEDFVKKYISLCIEYGYSIDTLSKQFLDSMDIESQKKEKEKEKEAVVEKEENENKKETAPTLEEEKQKIITETQRMFGGNVNTKLVLALCEYLHKKMTATIILQAINKGRLKTDNQKSAFSYADKTLLNWYNEGKRDIKDLTKEREEAAAKDNNDTNPYTHYKVIE